MTTLLEHYEQQYAVSTAEFTSKIAKLAHMENHERRKVVQELEKQVDELQELLEQMDLEVREVEPSQRAKMKTRLESYRAELVRLENEFKLKNSAVHSEGFIDQSDMFGEISLKEEQKQRLLDNSEKIERMGTQLNTGYRVLMETEEIGSQVLRDLNSQRETIEKSRARLRETNADLGLSSRIVNSMMTRSVQNKIILVSIGAIFIIVIILTIYFSAGR